MFVGLFALLHTVVILFNAPELSLVQPTFLPACPSNTNFTGWEKFNSLSGNPISIVSCKFAPDTKNGDDDTTLGSVNVPFQPAPPEIIVPYGIVSKNDVLYFINNNSEGLVKLKGVVLNVFNSDKMIQDESVNLVKSNQDKLCLTDKQFERWAGKRYIVLIEVKNIEKINPFKIDKRNYSNMDDWLPVTKIEDVMVN